MSTQATGLVALLAIAGAVAIWLIYAMGVRAWRRERPSPAIHRTPPYGMPE